MAQVPVEIFEIITSYLTRSDVKALRLVCREFEAKVSARFFRNVVVPFHPELYTRLRCNINDSPISPNPGLLTDGMCIFQSFGPHILRFALSLELDEDVLAHPPVKPSQQAIPTFWGIYRWPHRHYYRYTDLASLEDAADELQDMKAALGCLTKVRNLGLCCDAGLGFLSGPDPNAQKRRLAEQPVFSTVDWNLDGSSRHPTYVPDITVANFKSSPVQQNQAANPHPMAFRKGILERMVREAGYAASQVEDAVQVLLDTEGVSLENIQLEERSASPTHGAEPWLAQALDPGIARDSAAYALIPASLTLAQKEMLLELEWAHRAMIQSFVLAVVNNAINDICFDNVTTFTIAKLPSCHLHIFCRHDLWRAIPSLKNLSLGVIADWRQMVATHPTCVEDVSISPIQSVGKVFQLFNDYVGKNRNIESIHFEWICGGEFGVGSHQRNAYILPAPFYHRPELMALATVLRKNGTSKLLQLPYLKHLSLKNCWSSPHTLLQAVRQFALVSLEKLDLESVSLSGPPTTTSQPALPQPGVPPINQEEMPAFFPLPTPQNAHQTPLNNELGVPVQQQLMSPILSSDANDSAAIKTIDQPDFLTWAGLIDHFSPGVKVRNLVTKAAGQDMDAAILAAKAEAVRKYIPDVAQLRGNEKEYLLRHLFFRSCGYVAVDSVYLNTRAILPHGRESPSVSTNSDIKHLMQCCRDKLLARISPFIKKEEKRILSALGMTFGWEGVYDEHVIYNARCEGVVHPGQDRFNGSIEATGGKCRAAHHDGT